MFQYKGKKINIYAGVVIGDVQYPNLLDPALREQLGVVEVPDPVRPNDKFYFVTENEDGTLAITPRDIDGVKAALISEVKAKVASLLALSDWKLLREFEGGTACDQATKDYRAAVRKAGNDNEAAINAKRKIETLAELEFVWPEIPA